MDALTGQDLKRWFPLSSSSDFLYFLPARPSIDTARSLRLVSSSARISGSSTPCGSFSRRFSANRYPGSTSLISYLGVHREGDDALPDSSGPPVQASGRLFNEAAGECSLLQMAASSASHRRARPLSCGDHILFTDPSTGMLCLGTDRPVGSLSRLLRKVWFQPPSNAMCPCPVLYAAGADLRHGVRVVAAFAIHDGPKAGPAGRRGTQER